MGIEDKQRQWLQKWSLLEAIGSFVRLEKKQSTITFLEKKSKANQWNCDLVSLFANLQIWFWLGISPMSGGNMQFLILRSEAHKLLYLFSLSKYLEKFNFIEVVVDFWVLLILLGFFLREGSS